MLEYVFLFFNDTASTCNYTYCHTLHLHDALPISRTGVLHISCEEPVQEPALAAGGAVHAVAVPEEPIARAGFVLDLEIIANAEKCGVAQMPFAIDALDRKSVV